MTPHDEALVRVVSFLLIMLLCFAGFVMYFIPTLIAFKRMKDNRGAIFALNAFLGWTLVGWVVALSWALTVSEGSHHA